MRDEIIINGKKYDAITGELLSAPKNNNIKNKLLYIAPNSLHQHTFLIKSILTE